MGKFTVFKINPNVVYSFALRRPGKVNEISGPKAVKGDVVEYGHPGLEGCDIRQINVIDVPVNQPHKTGTIHSQPAAAPPFVPDSHILGDFLQNPIIPSGYLWDRFTRRPHRSLFAIAIGKKQEDQKRYGY